MENTMSSTKNDLGRKADAFADRAGNKADSLVSRAKEATHEFLDSDIKGQLADRWNQLRDRSEDVYNSSIDVVRKHPVATVGTALAVGVLAGMILKRRH